MAYKIVWTKRASDRLSNLTEYIEKEWCSKVAQQFVSGIFDTLDLLAEFPQMGSLEIKEKQIRGFLISKQTKLFYKFKTERLIVLALLDTRQNPTKK